MRNFREEYRKAMQELPQFHMDAGKVADEIHHRRMVAVRRRKQALSIASAACVLLMFSVGTAAAVSYSNSRIEMRDNGFSFLGQGSRSANNAMAKGAAAESTTADSATAESAAATYMKAEAYTEEKAYEGANEASYGTAAENQPEAVLEQGQEEAIYTVEDVECEERTYTSIEEFEKNEDITIAIPESEWLEDTEQPKSESVIVTDFLPMVHVRIDFEDKYFWMSQSDNREYPDYASSTVFPGEAANERVLINDQGMSFQVYDSVEEGKVISTHAAISVNGRDVIYNFSGFESDKVDAVLKQLDVSVYIVE